MSSSRRIESSRANGARSRGPVTPHGKKNSSRNAVRHGLLAGCLLLEGESAENFQAVFNQHLDRLQPADGVEYALVEEMAAAYWRLHRNWAVETRLWQNQADELRTIPDTLDRFTGAFNQLASGDTLRLAHRYETRLHNIYQRSLRTLLLLRTAKVPNEPNPKSGHFDPSSGLPPDAQFGAATVPPALPSAAAPPDVPAPAPSAVVPDAVAAPTPSPARPHPSFRARHRATQRRRNRLHRQARAIAPRIAVRTLRVTGARARR